MQEEVYKEGSIIGFRLIRKILGIFIVPALIVVGTLAYLAAQDFIIATIIGLIGISILIGILHFSINLLIIRPGVKIYNASKKIAEGDYSATIQIGSRDEMAKLGSAFNAMVSSIRALVDTEKLRIRQLGVLNEAVMEVSTELKLDLLADKLSRHVQNLSRSDGAIVFIFSREDLNIEHIKISGIEFSRPITDLFSKDRYLGRLTLEGVPKRIEGDSIDKVLAQLPEHTPRIRSFITIPLVLNNEVYGGIISLNKMDGSAYTQEDEDLLLTLALHAATAVEKVRLHEDTERMAITDGLTGLFNHREFQRRLDEEINRCRRYNRVFALLMLDIDHFKSFNDTYGHRVGDAVLKTTGSIIRAETRNVDYAARYGGEEFAVILPETDRDGGYLVAERIRSRIFERPFTTPKGEKALLTISIGVASFPLDADNREDIIVMTDQALYFAKESGRNYVCKYNETLKSALERNSEKLTEMLLDRRLESMRALASAVDAKSPYTRGHSDEVTRYAMLIGTSLGLSEGEKESLRIASLLHDIGTVSIPANILNKPGPLNPEEIKIIQAHPQLAEMMLKKAPQLDTVLPAVLYHHERFDGNGYPDGLKGEEIPYLARILAVVEAYHAMISVRPYKKKMTHDEAMAELKRNAGRQFDPGIVEAFIKLI